MKVIKMPPKKNYLPKTNLSSLNTTTSNLKTSLPLNHQQSKNIKIIKAISFTIALIVLAFFIYSLVNYKVLKNQVESSIDNQVEKYGYWAVFTLSFILEISPQPIASAIIPFTNGLILGLDPLALFSATLLGAILASFVAYAIGLRYGKSLTIKITGEETYEKYNKYFKKYGKAGMSLLALTPIPYFPIIGGLFKMKFKDFIIYAIIPRIIHLVVFGYILTLFF